MQFPDPSSSQSWADKILYGLIGGTVLSSVLGLVKLIFYRNKPRSEIARLDAEAALDRTDATVKLSSQLVVLHDKISLMEASIDTHQRANLEAIKYYRSQLEYFEKLDNVYRNRSHAMSGELGRLVLGIRMLEAEYTEKTGEAMEPFPIKTYDQIVDPFPLPPAPES